MNLSEKYKSFLWLPEKTGTNHAVKVFRNFEFFTYGNFNDGETKKELRANHWMEFFEGHENYKFICTARNPFDKFISLYKFNCKDSSLWHPKGFQEYFETIRIPQIMNRFLNPFGERNPDYYVRVESLYEDYIKIPFIRDSEFNTSGELEKYCNIKVNSTKEIKDISEYYTPKMIEYILKNGEDYFNTLGYNSFMN